ncbi:flagellar filament capping protein FliD [Frigoribacterium faeni]|uniref:Flagellar hook-associated protein 2 n=1 Tax=Frigoribacterium faeni TaxID=145483 RepID=A0A7W3JKU1_9MICO|nr:flagellar filament capping protein FliD [Frigoribacterium faeni]MBA8814700.1 flagellar hook-associated protein 2 [Frigoribacterium faeni]BFF15486.1 flagellar filament capping protein FliD [Microbacterium flavescens]GEK83471.1 flagellar hook-associated protein 2 [Frigoribacterium faeni]
MASLGIDGLVSGLDTTTLINTLMQSEAVPQTILKNKATAGQTLVAALQGLNSRIADLATLATSTAKAGSLSLFTPTSSSTAVTATTSAGAVSGSVDLVVGATASSKTAVTAAMTAWPDSPATLTFVSASGKTTEVTAASSSLDDVVKAVNASAAGVSAVKVASGTDASGAVQYRLQLSSTTSGAAGGFEVHRGTAADVEAGTAADLMAQPGAAVIAQARDASITLWAGTAAEQVVTSGSNTFADVIPGVSVTVSAVTAEPVHLTIARDATAATKVASDLIAGVNAALTIISTKSAATTSTSSSGTTTVTAGVFGGNSTTRGITQRLTDAVLSPVDGRSPSAIGISIDAKTGQFSVDAEKFAAALAADPEKVQATMSAIAARVASTSTAVSDKFDGSLTKVITGQQSVVRDLNDRVSVWDDRLAARRENLQKTYSALEVALSNLTAQQSYITSQLAGLSTSSS